MDMSNKIIGLLLQKLIDRADEVDSKEAMGKYEDSPDDEIADISNAKKHGMSVEDWEDSPGDQKADKEGAEDMAEGETYGDDDDDDDDDDEVSILKLFK